jgi:hypothetical protein
METGLQGLSFHNLNGYTSESLAEDVSEVLALSKGVSKLIPIDEQPYHQIVHLFCLGKANCTTHQTLDPGP